MTQLERIQTLLNQLFQVRPITYEELTGSGIKLNSEQGEIILELIKPFPELKPGIDQVTYWALVNCILDMITGKRIGLRVNKQNKIIHSVVFLEGLRKPSYSEPLVTTLNDEEDEMDEDYDED